MTSKLFILYDDGTTREDECDYNELDDRFHAKNWSTSETLNIEKLAHTDPPMHRIALHNDGTNPDGFAEVDLNRWQTEHVAASTSYSTAGSTSPLLLNEPSPHLKSAHIHNYTITQHFLDQLVACPNLERLIIISGSDTPLHVRAPANAEQIRTFAFKGCGTDTLEDWNGRILECLIVRWTATQEIPPRMTDSMLKKGAVKADLSNNEISTEGTWPLTRCPETCRGLLDLTGNPIEELPMLPDRANACYHIDGGTFKKRCDCSFNRFSAESSDMLRRVHYSRYEQEWLSNWERLELADETGTMPVVLRRTPMRNIFYSALEGLGRTAGGSTHEVKNFYTSQA